MATTTHTAGVMNGDILAYEFADPTGEWLWSVGRVLAVTHPRVLTLEMWVPQKRTNLTKDEKKRATATMEKIVVKQKQLGEERATIQRLVSELTVKSEEVQTRMDDCETELADVLPVLEEAKRALGGISLKELREIKAYVQPPVVVKLVMEAVLTVIGEGKKAEQWDYVKGCLTDTSFMPRVKYFDPIEMTPDTIRKVTRITEHQDFTFERAQRASKAAGPLQKWVEAQLAYIAAVPDHLKPLLEQARLLKQELRDVENSKMNNEIRVSQIEAEVKKLLQLYNDTMHGEGVKVNYDKDGLACLTREIPTGSWTPADQRKLSVLRTSILCILASPGRTACFDFTFNKESAEAVRAAVNGPGEGQAIMKPIPKTAFLTVAVAAVAVSKIGGGGSRNQSPRTQSRGSSQSKHGPSRNNSFQKQTTPSPTPPATPLRRVPTPPPGSASLSSTGRDQLSKEPSTTARTKRKSTVGSPLVIDPSTISTLAPTTTITIAREPLTPSTPIGSKGGEPVKKAGVPRNARTAETAAERKSRRKSSVAAAGERGDRGGISSAVQSVNIDGSPGSRDRVGIPAPPPLLPFPRRSPSQGGGEARSSRPPSTSSHVDDDGGNGGLPAVTSSRRQVEGDRDPMSSSPMNSSPNSRRASSNSRLHRPPSITALPGSAHSPLGVGPKGGEEVPPPNSRLAALPSLKKVAQELQ